MTGFKPLYENKAVNTDSVGIGSQPSEAIKCSKSPASKQKAPKVKRRHITTQTEASDEAVCLKPVTGMSLKPYLEFRHSPEPGICEEEKEEEEEVEQSDKVEWMFHSTDTCARTHAMRSQVRLLRALKKNLEKYRPTDYNLKLYGGVIPDEIGWDALGADLQTSFIRLYKLMHLLELLPVNKALKKSSVRVADTLKHLLSHLPFPNSLTDTIDISKINQPRTDAMAAYLFGWKLREVINVLRFVYKNKLSLILPDYFKAEIVQADKLVYENLVFAMQGMRNMAIPHEVNNDDDFLACDEAPYYSGNLDFSSDNYSDLSDIDDTPVTPQQKTTSVGEDSTDVPPSPVNDLSEEQREALEKLNSWSNPTKVLKGLSMTQLVSMAGIVQSRIEKIKSNAPIPKPPEKIPESLPRFLPEAVKRFMSHGAPIAFSSSSIPNLGSRASSRYGRPLLPAPPATNRGSSPVDPNFNAPSSSGLHGRVLPKPVSQFTDISQVVSATSRGSSLQPPSSLAAGGSLPRRVTPTASGLPSSAIASSQRPLHPFDHESSMTCARVSVTPDDVFSSRYARRCQLKKFTAGDSTDPSLAASNSSNTSTRKKTKISEAPAQPLLVWMPLSHLSRPMQPPAPVQACFQQAPVSQEASYGQAVQASLDTLKKAINTRRLTLRMSMGQPPQRSPVLETQKPQKQQDVATLTTTDAPDLGTSPGNASSKNNAHSLNAVGPRPLTSAPVRSSFEPSMVSSAAAAATAFIASSWKTAMGTSRDVGTTRSPQDNTSLPVTSAFKPSVASSATTAVASKDMGRTKTPQDCTSDKVGGKNL